MFGFFATDHFPALIVLTYCYIIVGVNKVHMYINKHSSQSQITRFSVPYLLDFGVQFVNRLLIELMAL